MDVSVVMLAAAILLIVVIFIILLVVALGPAARAKNLTSRQTGPLNETSFDPSYRQNEFTNNLQIKSPGLCDSYAQIIDKCGCTYEGGSGPPQYCRTFCVEAAGSGCLNPLSTVSNPITNLGTNKSITPGNLQCMRSYKFATSSYCHMDISKCNSMTSVPLPVGCETNCNFYNDPMNGCKS
jgi:hypothetical protein